MKVLKASKALAFWGEVRRRNVLRAGAVYVAAVWALSQGLAQLLPVFDGPNWITRWFVVACVIGFPFWIAFAWFFELTPTGVKRESEIAPGASVTRATGRKLDFWIIGILSVVVVLLVTNTFVLHRDTTSTTDVADAQALEAVLDRVPKQSVAVLPLTDESGNSAQQYFSDGLSEELISELTQISGLKVIGKYSSFKFRDSRDSPAQIGAALGVANLIQGAVFRQGDKIRVTVGMIRAKDGISVWSHSYDEQLKDVFAIQSKIGQAVAAALKIKLLGKAIVANDKPPGGNVEAYRLMLQGRAIYRQGTQAAMRQGIALYQQALKLDPKYAYAWGLLSNASINLGVLYLTGDARQQAYVQARVAAASELALAPGAAFTHTDRGYLLATVDNDPVGALAEYKRAYALAPHETTSMNFLANGLLTVGQLPAAVDLFHKAIATDPLRVDIYSNLALALLGQRQLDAAEQVTRKALGLQAHFPGLHMILAEIDILRGDAAAASRDAEQETNPVQGPWILAMTQQVSGDHKQADAALHEYIAGNGKDQPYLVADLYALRKQPDQMFQWLRRALAQHDPNLITNLLSDPFALAYQHDPHYAALCKQTGLPEPARTLPAASGSSKHRSVVALLK